MGDTIRFRNIGTLLTGDVRSPLGEATALLVRNGVIAALGDDGVMPDTPVDVDIDVRGATLAPGLWDSHFHPYFGDYSPRQEANSTVTRTVRAGVTSFVSAGPGHQPGMYLPSAGLPNVQAASRLAAGHDPGRARDAAGAKALAITMAQAWRDCHPMGAKVYAGTVFAENGYNEADFRDMAANGIRILKLQRPISRLADATRYARWAREAGMLVMTHTGNRALTKDAPSILASLQAVAPDIAGHVNGGPSPAPKAAVDWLIETTTCTLELVFIGNMRLAAQVLLTTVARDEMERITIGSDLPGGTGIVPTAVLRTIQLLNQLTDVPVEVLFAMASGNTARANRLPGGRIAAGEPADIVIWDPADGTESETFLEAVTVGDRPYPGLIMVDGVVVEHGNPLLLEPKRMPILTTTRPESRP